MEIIANILQSELAFYYMDYNLHKSVRIKKILMFSLQKLIFIVEVPLLVRTLYCKETIISDSFL